MNLCFTFLLVVFQFCIQAESRSFVISGTQFLKDGQPFQYVSGSLHYFRVPPQFWPDRLAKMKFGGLTAIQTYIEWSTIERIPGVYDFAGQNNFTHFILEAQRQGLLVILRPGPYICAERDLGGFPYWLLKEQGIKLRSSDPKFLKPVDRWLDVMLPMIRPLLYRNGGPIITVQLENEFGSWNYGEEAVCDYNYTMHLKKKFQEHLGLETVLFTADGPGKGYLHCGAVSETLTTLNFAPKSDPASTFSLLPQRPWVNSELYSGWLDAWGGVHSTRSTSEVVQGLDKILSLNASASIYMYHGGTNFGFTSGSDVSGSEFLPVPTSYDYDAPITEAGDLTEKFFAIKKVIQKYFPEVPERNITNSTKMNLPVIKLVPVGSIFDYLPKNAKLSENPMTFENLDHPYGFVLYSTVIQESVQKGEVLSVPIVNDRAQVFVNKKYIGTLHRTSAKANATLNMTIPELISAQSSLDILVENQGRIFHTTDMQERKGLLLGVFLAQTKLTNWTHFKIYEDWNNVISSLASTKTIPTEKNPGFYRGEFQLPDEPQFPGDSFLKLSSWNKGQAFLNGHNLGRYWPKVGPQRTLYAPSVYFKKYPDKNEIVLFELEDSPCQTEEDRDCSVEFVKNHIIY